MNYINLGRVVGKSAFEESGLGIIYCTQEEYDIMKAAGTLNENTLYCTPELDQTETTPVSPESGDTFVVNVPNSWTYNNQYYSTTISCDNITADMTPIVDLYIPEGTSSLNVTNMLISFSCMDRIVTSDHEFTIYCYNNRPTIAISLIFKV